MDNIALFLALQALFFVFFGLWFKAKLRRFADEDGMLSQARRDVASLIVELDGTTDRNLTIIEDKLTELKSLIGDAEKRIALLARDKPQRSRAPDAYDRHGLALPFDGAELPAAAAAPRALGRPTTEAPVAEARSAPEDTDAAAPGAYAYSGLLPDQTTISGDALKGADLPQVRLRSRPVAPAAAAPMLRQSSAPLAIDEPFPDRVMALHRRGMSTELIASQLGAHLSEVEIVVAMEEGRSRRSGNA